VVDHEAVAVELADAFAGDGVGVIVVQAFLEIPRVFDRLGELADFLSGDEPGFVRCRMLR
jgi:hypothetical protein